MHLGGGWLAQPNSLMVSDASSSIRVLAWFKPSKAADNDLSLVVMNVDVRMAVLPDLTLQNRLGDAMVNPKLILTVPTTVRVSRQRHHHDVRVGLQDRQHLVVVPKEARRHTRPRMKTHVAGHDHLLLPSP